MGPWVAVGYQIDEFMVHRRNPYYWKVDEAGNQLPYLEEVTFEKGPSGIGRTLGTLGRLDRPHQPREPQHLCRSDHAFARR